MFLPLSFLPSSSSCPLIILFLSYTWWDSTKLLLSHVEEDNTWRTHNPPIAKTIMYDMYATVAIKYNSAHQSGNRRIKGWGWTREEWKKIHYVLPLTTYSIACLSLFPTLITWLLQEAERTHRNGWAPWRMEESACREVDGAKVRQQIRNIKRDRVVQEGVVVELLILLLTRAAKRLLDWISLQIHWYK